MSMLLLVAVLFCVGIVLLLLEFFVIPGFGVIGVLGVASLLGAIGVSWWKLGPGEAAIALVLSVGVVGGLLWYLPKSRAGKAMVLSEVQLGTATVMALVEVGNEGVAATPLRPSGMVRFADREVDVVSEGVFVDAGTAVRVTRVEGSRVFVEPVANYMGG